MTKKNKLIALVVAMFALGGVFIAYVTEIAAPHSEIEKEAACHRAIHQKKRSEFCCDHHDACVERARRYLEAGNEQYKNRKPETADLYASWWSYQIATHARSQIEGEPPAELAELDALAARSEMELNERFDTLLNELQSEMTKDEKWDLVLRIEKEFPEALTDGPMSNLERWRVPEQFRKDR